MTQQDVIELFELCGVSSLVYSIGSESRNDHWSLFVNQDGQWVVSYGERGQRSTWRVCASEHEACMLIIARVLSDSTQQGPIFRTLKPMFEQPKSMSDELYEG